MLNKQQMVDYIASGCKPKEEWRIGTEHEKFPFRLSDQSMIPYEGPDGIEALLNGMTRYNWQEVKEAGKIIALTKDQCSVSLEPAGQFELSGAPLRDLHATCGEVHTHLAEVKGVCAELGLGMLGLGFNPTAAREDLFWMPKGRYKLMSAYMPTVGSRGLDMMQRSCTVQVNLDFSSEEDMVKKLRVGLALQPVASALFANSPFKDGKPSGYLSYRMHVWQDVDRARTGSLPFVFEDGFGFEAYAEQAMKVPMYFVYRHGTYHNFLGQSFERFNAGELAHYFDAEVKSADRQPQIRDWEDHLSTFFPHVRMKKFLEMRGADVGSWSNICALPALWVGLLYDQSALDAAYDLIKDVSFAQIHAMEEAVPAQALSAEALPDKGFATIKDLAHEVLAIAESGLKTRAIFSASAMDETQYLQPIKAILERGTTDAEELLRLYHGPWNGDVSKVFETNIF